MTEQFATKLARAKMYMEMTKSREVVIDTDFFAELLSRYEDLEAASKRYDAVNSLLSDAISMVPSGFDKRRLNLKLVEIMDGVPAPPVVVEDTPKVTDADVIWAASRADDSATVCRLADERAKSRAICDCIGNLCTDVLNNKTNCKLRLEEAPKEK